MLHTVACCKTGRLAQYFTLGLEMEVDVLVVDASENMLLAGVPTTLE